MLQRNYKILKRVLTRKILGYAVLAIVGSTGLVAIEALLALSLLLLLNALGLDLSTNALSPKLRAFFDTVPRVVILIVVTGFFRFMFQFFVNFGSASFKEQVNFHLRRAYFYKSLLWNKGRQENPSHANFIVGKAIPVSSEFSHQFVTLIGSMLQALGIFALMVSIAPRESLCVVVVMVVGGAFARFVSRRINKLAAKVPSQDVLIFQNLQRILRNWIFVRIMRLEQRECKNLVSNAESFRKSYMHYAIYQNLNFGLVSFLGVLIVALIIYFAHEVLHTDSAVLLSFLYLVLRFVTAATAGIGITDSLFVGYHYVSQVLNEFSEFTDADSQKILSLGQGMLLQDQNEVTEVEHESLTIPPDIVIHDLWYRYASDAPWVLKGLNVTLQPGAQLGIVGPSGAGKSTMLSLALGITHPVKGSVQINGELAFGYLEKHPSIVGYVGPDPFIIAGTIRQNLLYGLNKTLDDETLWEALTFVAITDEIKSMPGKLDYRLAESGEGLSVGQKQRLALARALLRRPKLLVLDECSSNLDDATEALVATTLQALKGKITTLIVAHRKGILKHADHTIEMEPQSDYR